MAAMLGAFVLAGSGMSSTLFTIMSFRNCGAMTAAARVKDKMAMAAAVSGMNFFKNVEIYPNKERAFLTKMTINHCKNILSSAKTRSTVPLDETVSG